MKELINLNKILKELRKQSSLTQKKVAISLGITYQSYQAYELGITVPTLENFIKIAKLYNVSLDFLIGNSNY